MEEANERLTDEAPRGPHYDGEHARFDAYVDTTKRTGFVERRDGHGRNSEVQGITFAEHDRPVPDSSTSAAENARREAVCSQDRIAGAGDPLEEKQESESECREASATVADLAAECLARDQAKHRSLREHRRIVERYNLPAIGHLPSAEVRKADILRLVEGMSE
ncbi:MAG TPA: hypothetical protein ENJ38_03875 [Rhodospirillales bacterium]|nr:hypothetical protein [Rhodospirillales bacterium]